MNKQESCDFWTCEYIKVSWNSGSQDKGISQGSTPATSRLSEDRFILILKMTRRIQKFKVVGCALQGEKKTFFQIVG